MGPTSNVASDLAGYFVTTIVQPLDYNEPTRRGNPTSLERIPLFATLPSWPGDARELLG